MNNNFLCLGFSSHTRFFHSYETSSLHVPVRGCKFWYVIGSHSHWEWGFFIVPHLPGQMLKMYDYLRKPVTFTHVTKRLAVDMTILRFSSIKRIFNIFSNIVKKSNDSQNLNSAILEFILKFITHDYQVYLCYVHPGRADFF